MSQLAVVHSGRAINVVGDGVKVKVTNQGGVPLYLGPDDRVSVDLFDDKLEPGASKDVTGPLSVSASDPCEVLVEDEQPEPAPAKPKPKAMKPKPKSASRARRTKPRTAAQKKARQARDAAKRTVSKAEVQKSTPKTRKR